MKITVGPLRPSEFPNYDALTVHMDGNEKKADYDFLLSKDGKTLLRMTKLDLTKDPYAENMKKINIGGRPMRGNKDAKVVVVNYDDFQCPFCSRMHQTLFPEILKEYGDRVQFVYKDYPLGGDSSLGDACRGRCQLPGGAEQRRLLGFCRLHPRQSAGSQRREEPRPAIRSARSLDHCCKARNTTWTRPNCSPASRRRTTMP